jgi:hypothetical protein
MIPMYWMVGCALVALSFLVTGERPPFRRNYWHPHTKIACVLCVIGIAGPLYSLISAT